MSLVGDIKTIQRAVGATADGVFGPRTARKVLEHLARLSMVEPPQDAEAGRQDGGAPLDERTRRILDTLDSKAVEQFTEFLLLAKATAATYGCDYVAISGTRSWDEQSELYRTYQSGGPKAAPPGYSWHNFGTAIDCGVFRGKAYLDDSDAETASRVHAACAAHAQRCGLAWGGAWKGRSCDPPHYQIQMGRAAPTATDRAKYKQEGTVL